MNSKRVSLRKVLVIGLDGATWQVAQPLMSGGEMPNLQRLVQRGASGTFVSLEPMLSPRLWATLATGKRPERHGVLDFYATQHDLRAVPIWDVVQSYGGSIGLVGWIPTWPPRQVEGFIIPGWMARDTQTYPAEYSFIKILDIGEKSGSLKLSDYARLGWTSLRRGISSQTMLSGLLSVAQDKLGLRDYLDSMYEKRILKQAMYAEVFIYLYNRFQPTFGAVVLDSIDGMSHLYWKYIDAKAFPEVTEEERKRYGGVIPACYKSADELIGRIIKHVDKETLIVVCSDHGFRADPAGVRIGYNVRARNLAEELHLDNMFRFSMISGVSYWCVAHDHEEQGTQLLEDLADKIDQIRLAGSVQKVFESRQVDPLTLKVAARPIEGIGVQSRISGPGFECEYGHLVEPHSGSLSGTHDEEGLLVLAGPGIKRGATLGNASVLDLTPTLLAWIGLPVARDMDGNPLVEAFESSFLSSNPLMYVDSYDPPNAFPAPEYQQEEVNEAVEERLRLLGYID